MSNKLKKSYEENKSIDRVIQVLDKYCGKRQRVMPQHRKNPLGHKKISKSKLPNKDSFVCDDIEESSSLVSEMDLIKKPLKGKKIAGLGNLTAMDFHFTTRAQRTIKIKVKEPACDSNSTQISNKEFQERSHSVRLIRKFGSINTLRGVKRKMRC